MVKFRHFVALLILSGTTWCESGSSSKDAQQLSETSSSEKTSSSHSFASWNIFETRYNESQQQLIISETYKLVRENLQVVESREGRIIGTFNFESRPELCAMACSVHPDCHFIVIGPLSKGLDCWLYSEFGETSLVTSSQCEWSGSLETEIRDNLNNKNGRVEKEPFGRIMY